MFRSLLIYLLFLNFATAQTTTINGIVEHENVPLKEVTILYNKHLSTQTDVHGHFKIVINSTDSLHLALTKSGYQPQYIIVPPATSDTTLRFTLLPDYLHLHQIVITATRTEGTMTSSPVLVSTITKKNYEQTQAVALSEGLNFTPGLRLETNCQNCGFTQVRMNGLEGAYSQILINSRPVFSALAGVYGLDMVPANMIDRIEVVRGGGSVLYGGNAIAGTVNIITSIPQKNTIEAGFHQAFTHFTSPDRTITLNGTWVNKEVTRGVSIYGFNRNRQPWDANADGLTEITLQKNNTIGLDAFYKFSPLAQLKLGIYSIQEHRRGGTELDRLPHQSALAEVLDHTLYGLNSSFDVYTKNYRQKWTVFLALQTVQRDSYYGSGGRIIPIGDSITEQDILALNSYGNATDFSTNAGIQHTFEWHKKVRLLTGSDITNNRIVDHLPGYSRTIEQHVTTWGAYTQIEWTPTTKLTILPGIRHDLLHIQGHYWFDTLSFTQHTTLPIIIPRIATLYKWNDKWQTRFSWAKGYRGPQAFDEDLHLAAVAGTMRFSLLDNELSPERSDSYSLSINRITNKDKWQMRFALEGFFTQLHNPFITANPVSFNDNITIMTKRNGSGANVSGLHIEGHMSYTRKYSGQVVLSLQQANYHQAELIWEPIEGEEGNQLTTHRLLRTPSAYGYYIFTYQPKVNTSVSLSGIYTGSMLVAHVVNTQTGEMLLKNTPSFFEQHLKISHTIRNKKSHFVTLFGGMQNIFNSFQKDLDWGVLRDGSYIYGPSRPRTIYFGLKIGVN
jgi:outer membrane receptor for ferrienterochelin and colicins